MTTRRAVVILLLAAACGRYRFDPLDDSGTGADATPPDVTESCGHTFCDDFDRPGPLTAGWDSSTNSGLATPALENGQYRLQLPGTSNESAFIEKNLPQASSSIVVHVRLGWDSTTPGAAEIDMVQLRWLTLPGACTSFGYFLVRDGTGPFNLQETYGGCGGNEQNYLGSLDNMGLREMTMTVTLGAIGVASVRLDIDGTTVVEHTTSHAIEPSTLQLRLGGGAVRNVVAPWDIRFDDLYVDVL